MSLKTVCRLCLATDAPVHNIVDSPLRGVYEKLTDKSLTAARRPAVACFLCYSQLRKCHNLMVKSVRADEVLTQILQSGRQVDVKCTTMKIREIQHLNELSVTPLELIVIPGPGHNTINENIKEEPLLPQCKEEIDTDRRRFIDYLMFEDSDNGEDTDREELRNVANIENYGSMNREYINALLEDAVDFERRGLTGSGDIKKEKPEETEIYRRRCIVYLQFQDSEGEDDIGRVDLRDVESIEDEKLTDVKKEHNESEQDTEKMGVAGAAPAVKCKKTHADKTQDGSTLTSDGKNILQKRRTHRAVTEEATSRGVGSYTLRSTKKGSDNRQVAMNTSMCCDNEIYKSNVSINSDNDCASTNTGVDNSNSEQLMKYICNYCGRMFDDKYHLIEHIKRHNAVKKKRNQKRSHQYTKLRKTKHNRARSVIRHTETDSSKNTFECEICKARFSHSGNLKRHLTTHSGDRSYECELCKVRFRLSSHLKVHLRLHTREQPYQCEICKARFSHSGNLKRHLTTHSGDRLYECEICKARFNQSSTLKTHLTTHSGDKLYECEICKVRFSHNSSLKRHLTKHSGDKPYECEICKARFSHSGNLKRHLTTHSGGRPYECEICKARFSQSSNLNTHLTTHSGDKPYECKICKVRFSHNSSLKRHLTTHSGDKPYECEICKARFSHSGNLKRHLTTHSGDRPYECDICRRRFSLRQYLIDHLRSHTGDKRCECEICKVRFSQSSNLKRHLTIHSGDRRCECDICRRRFRLKYSLVGHLRIHAGQNVNANKKL